MKKSLQKGSMVAWVSLVVGAIALILSWVAIDRTGADVEEEFDEALAEIRADFEDLEARLRAETSQELREGADDVSRDDDPNNAGE